MTVLQRRLNLIVRLYMAVALAAAAVLSPLSFSFVPLLILGWSIFVWLRRLSPAVVFLTTLFVFFALAVLFSETVPFYFSTLISLPVMLGVNIELQKTAAVPLPSSSGRKPTSTLLLLIIFILVLFLLSLAVASPVMAVATGIVTVYLAGLSVYIFKNMPSVPVTFETIQTRIVAGDSQELPLSVHPLGKATGRLLVVSVSDWVKVKNPDAAQKDSQLSVVITPSLAGPSAVELTGFACDRWGLWQQKFSLTPLTLLIIPRAKYALWLARKYISGARLGSLPLISSLSSLKSLQGLRLGIEYYGNRFYQPGDSLKQIDWKHSSKYNEMVSKEFTEFQGQPAVILINLSANNPEEADIIAGNLLMTALTLGTDNIPAALAAYNQKEVILITEILSAIDLVVKAMNLINSISIEENPQRYLNPPDITRLRTNIRRISQSDSLPARKLSALLKLEYRNFSRVSTDNPCSETINLALARVRQQVSLIIISQRNHDAEALAFNSYLLSQKGNTVLSV